MVARYFEERVAYIAFKTAVTAETSLLDPFSEGLGAYLNEADAVGVCFPYLSLL